MLMIEISEKSKCTGCGACQNICPKNCVEMLADEEGFLYPKVRNEYCINCRLCEKVCDKPGKIITDYSDRAFGVISSRENIRKRSSSGGVFSLLADFILDNDGIVFGAYFNNKWSVEHGYVNTKNDIDKLRGSKYVQSDTRYTYREVKQFLELGKTVLFTGTGCQIKGLKSFLGKDYENLICQDIVCHGVTPPRLLKKYLELLKKKYKSEVRSISFRDKSTGWKNYSVKILFTNGKSYLKRASDDLYMRSFLSKLYLRPSCYECPCKGEKRESDITLGDFWGVNKIMPELDDDNGCSLVIIHSKKGMELFNSIKEYALFKEVEFSKVEQYNKAIIESAEKPQNREKFIKEVNDNFARTIKNYCKIPVFLMVKIKIWRLFASIKK
ncbi:Coenzyme F420 hydrogenase/dehydrogenase, beta subunit C-terminal domain [Lachnoclostridium sp. An118]|uniref:Coenzyme F420 hydrogenase/dehydrogenase, beta subunit C-terminal domain n=1 Tax=Lachnoclostridium sp. An118 TaxID=1965547 RepID=UPI000B39E27C|nr:Coenzyme F420 hydrogenase/dehydrogenase, beta subunit C-terminal domain [Lachnoclostridium sp. An118]OUQ47372.1 hypothetical protein B5E62_15315 [Lachnoclostridium sp. An118]